MNRAFRIAAAALPLALAWGDETKPSPSAPPERSEVAVDDPKLKADIEDCIRRGVTWLKARQEPSGAWPELDPGNPYPGNSGTTYNNKYELTGLALLALLKCDVSSKDPCIMQGFEWLKKNGPSRLVPYGPAVVLMALEAKDSPKEAVQPKNKKQKYAKPKPLQLNPGDGVWAGQLAAQILSNQHACGGWRYGSGSATPLDMEGGKPGVADVSATQYALLGLHAARHMAIPVDSQVFYRASDFLLAQQEAEGPKTSRVTERAQTGADNPKPEEEAAGDYGKDRIRGWPYMKGAADRDESRARAGMTCAGIVGMLICRNACMDDKGLKKEERAKRLTRMEQAVYDGLAWLDAHWSVEENYPVETEELGYYLYALERVGVMADLRFIGPGHDWYLEGARVWTSSMQKEGGDKGFWAAGAGRPKPETQDTPYGLLFLRKAVLLSYPIGEAE